VILDNGLITTILTDVAQTRIDHGQHFIGLWMGFMHHDMDTQHRKRQRQHLKLIKQIVFFHHAAPGEFIDRETHYGDRSRWTLIYYSNQHVLEGPSVIPGKTLHIPCAQQATAPDATPLRKDDAEMKLLTGGGFAPFTDQALPGQGMVTELVNAALELTPAPVSYSLNQRRSPRSRSWV